jgi:LmbE family N-acetylglucosaminyl deacetylase
MHARTRIERSLAGDAPWLFLSPHLDDAVLSCGALIEAQARGREIVVATLFTEATPGPHTRAARSFLRQCTHSSALDLFEARKTEDNKVLVDMGARPLHMGGVDALFRRRRPPRFGSSAWDRVLPELTHRYPTYRFDIALGRIAGADKALINRLQGDVAELMAITGAELLFCPVGVGRHVDHLITREAGMKHQQSLVLYSDFPYDLVSGPDTSRLERLGYVPWSWDQGLSSKPGRIRQYATQADALFPDGQIPPRAETYFVPAQGN